MAALTAAYQTPATRGRSKTSSPRLAAWLKPSPNMVASLDLRVVAVSRHVAGGLSGRLLGRPVAGLTRSLTLTVLLLLGMLLEQQVQIVLHNQRLLVHTLRVGRRHVVGVRTAGVELERSLELVDRFAHDAGTVLRLGLLEERQPLVEVRQGGHLGGGPAHDHVIEPAGMAFGVVDGQRLVEHLRRPVDVTALERQQA